MNSSRPFLVKALISWILDNKMTPYVAIAVGSNSVEIPEEHVVNGQIVLNVSPSAVRDFEITQEEISLMSRFKGVTKPIKAPTGNIIAVYSKESGAGMQFELEADFSKELESQSGVRNQRDGPNLKLV